MTNQEVFDRVVTHARRQRVKAMANCSCVYRTGDGLCCFAGCLIPEAEYRSCFEGCCIGTITPITSRVEDLNLLYGLQKIHDFCDPSGWEEQFRQLVTERVLITGR